MADVNSPTPPARGVLPDHGDLIAALLDIRGTVQLSRQAVHGTMSRVTLEDDPERSSETLQAVEGALSLAEAAIERLWIELEALRNGWPTPIEELAHG